MNKILLLLLSFIFGACLEKNNEVLPVYKEHVNLSGEWKFSIGDDMNWAKSDYNDNGWEKINVPNSWENEGFHGYDGYGWYRKHFKVPEQIKNKALYLSLGYIDDVDEVYINGQLAGFSGSFPPDYSTAYYANRKYPLPVSLLNFTGDNVIAVRVYDDELGGGIQSGDIGIYSLEDHLAPEIVLEGNWKLRMGDSLSWTDISYNDSSWKNVTVPSYWEGQIHGDYDGFGWYRKTFDVPNNLLNKKLILVAGKIDDLDQVYINGKLVGSTGSFEDTDNMYTNDFFWTKMRNYYLPDSLLYAGRKNVIAIRVYDAQWGGGIYEGPVGIISQEKYTKYWRYRNK